MLPDRLVVSPALVGRAGELRYLQQQLDMACSGSGRCVLVTGEAGIGKSRLLAELRSMAGEQCRVFAIHCYEEDSASPYAPLIDALRLHVARLAPAAAFAALGPQAADLLPLLPELSPAVPPDRPAPRSIRKPRSGGSSRHWRDSWPGWRNSGRCCCWPKMCSGATNRR